MARTPNDAMMRWILRRATENRDHRKGGAVDILNDEVVAKWYRLPPGSRGRHAAQIAIARSMKTLERRGLGRRVHGTRPRGGRSAGLVLTAAGLALGRRLPKSRTLPRPEKRRVAYAPKFEAELLGFDLKDDEDRRVWEDASGLTQLAIVARRERDEAALARKQRAKKPKKLPRVSGRDPRLPPTRRSFTPHRAI